MFTGLVESMQPIKSNASSATGRRLDIDLGVLAPGVKSGDSICVNGVCLSVSRLRGSQATFDVMAETIRATTLAALTPGTPVNLERALPADGRFGGHIVQGHVDAVGTVDRVERPAGQQILWVAAPPEIMSCLIRKGSVALDGVSLTVVNVEKGRFSVSLIPATLRDTTLGALNPGDKVNLEADIISKWICRRLDELFGPGWQVSAPPPLTMEKLREEGFI